MNTVPLIKGRPEFRAFNYTLEEEEGGGGVKGERGRGGQGRYPPFLLQCTAVLIHPCTRSPKSRDGYNGHGRGGSVTVPAGTHDIPP